MALRTLPVPTSIVFSQWRDKYNLLAQDVGDLTSLTTSSTNTIVDSINSLKTEVDGITLGALNLSNDTYFPSTGIATTLGNNPITTSNGSNVLTISHTAHGYETGWDIVFAGATGFAGLLANQINGTRTVTVVDANSYTIIAGANANASVTGGGNAVTVDSTINLIKATTDNFIKLGKAVKNLFVVGGKITGITPLGVAEGGTGVASISAFKTAYDLEIGVDLQAWDVNLDQIAALSPAADNIIIGNSGGTSWEAISASTARTRLGLAIGSNVQAWDVNLDQIAALNPSTNIFLLGNGSSWETRDAAYIKSNVLGLVVGQTVQAWDVNLDQIAALDPTANSIIIGNSGGSSWESVSGATARTRLGLAIGTNVQAWSTKLDQLAALSSTADSIIIGNSGGTSWEAITSSAARTRLGLAIGTNVQAYSLHLDSLTSLSKTSGNFVVATGTTWGVQDPTTVRTTLSVRPGIDVQAFNARLQDLSATTANTNNFIVGSGGSWISTNQAGAQAAMAVRPGIDVQVQNTRLQQLATGLTQNQNYFLYSDGSNYQLGSPSFLRSILNPSGVNSDITTLNGITEQSYTCTFTASAGTSVSQGSGSATYVKVGKFVIVHIEANVTLSGTLSGTVFFTLPFTPARTDRIISGYSNGLSSNLLQIALVAGSFAGELRAFGVTSSPKLGVINWVAGAIDPFITFSYITQ